MNDRTAILLLAHGTPEALHEIPEYLRNVTSGRPLPQEAIDEITHRYGLIGHSPLTEWTNAQARLLAKQLDVPVYVGMRNWKPYIATTVRQMRDEGVTAAAAICLAPQNSRTSVGLYRRAVLAEADQEIAVDFTDAWADHPLLVEAFADRLRSAYRALLDQLGKKAPVLFTAHSVPCRTIQSAPVTVSAAKEVSSGPDPYAIEAKSTAALVAARLAGDGLTPADWFFAFQSQGMSGGPWIGPTVEDTLTALRNEGHTAVMIQPIGFLCDHVEILYDIDIGFREFGARLGLRIERPESLNGSPILTGALADLAKKAVARLAARSAFAVSTR
ncbi:MAG: Ferrochelatase, protoheme ferro-lyase [Acidobacteriaceae bacterium]|nr:Ferrochelatase, protoheme ferro-lyase [Acidobacteriaceae bacterium]